MNTDLLLDVEGLTVRFPTPAGVLTAVDGVSLRLGEGESLGLVGESGCGKTVTALSILGLVPKPGRVECQALRFRGRDLATLDEAKKRKLRGREMAIVFQEPMRSLNPVLQCGEQVGEVLRVHLGMGGRAARARTLSLFEQVGLPDGAEIYHAFPHQLSGGMRQRVMIAMALGCDPLLLLADEPTTALDVTIEAQIVSLLASLRHNRRLAVLFISHNLALVSETCEKVAVMYAGRIVEAAPVDEIFDRPLHPYTRALIECLPKMEGPPQRPTPIPGDVPHGLALPPGCRFSDRCPLAVPVCREREPRLSAVGSDRSVRCWLCEEERGGGA